jgi:hypothetical protein
MMTTSNELSDSLLAAMTTAKIPAANHDFIQRFTAEVGITDYRVVQRQDKWHVVATRRDGLPALHIFYGYTNGFTSKEEIVRVAGAGVPCAPSSRKGKWYVEHPISQVRAGAERARDARREGSFCTCGMQLSLTGVCSNCY